HRLPAHAPGGEPKARRGRPLRPSSRRRRRRQNRVRAAMDDTPRPILEHLEELRVRLIWIIGVWSVGAIAASFWSKELFAILMAPAVDAVRASGNTLIAVAPSELFMTYLKTSILVGFMCAMPVALWQLWKFGAPGLYEHERRYALPCVIST